MKEIGEIKKLSSSAICYYMKKYDLNSREAYCKSNYLELEEDAIEFLDGLLLGDGGLCWITKNVSVKYGHTDKHKDFLYWLKDNLEKFDICLSGNIAKRTDGSIRYSLQSKAYRGSLVNLRKRWYPNDSKRIPKNFEITPNKLFLWFIGDGNLHEQGYFRIANSTFEKESIENLSTQLGLKVQKSGDYYFLKSKERVKNIFKEIDYKIPKCYNYKFEGDEIANCY